MNKTLIVIALFGVIASATLTQEKPRFRVPADVIKARHNVTHLDEFEDNNLQVRPSFHVTPMGSGSAALTGGIHGPRNSLTGTINVNPNSGNKFGGASADFSHQFRNGNTVNFGPDVGSRGNLGAHVGASGSIGRNGQWNAGGSIMSNPGGRPSVGANVGASWRF